MAECTCADPQAVAQAIKGNADTIKSALKSDEGQPVSNQVKSTGEYIDETWHGKNQVDVNNNHGEHGNMAKMEFCHWNAPEYGVKGQRWYAEALKAAGLAIAIANGIAQAEIADKQQDLADKWYSHARYKWDRFDAAYKPLEIQILNETSTTPIQELDCAGDKDRALTAVSSSYDSIQKYLRDKARSMRVCFDAELLGTLNTRQAMMLVDSTNFNLVDDQWFVDWKNDKRWSNRSQILDLGRNLASEALQYGQVANTLYNKVGGQIDRAAQGVMNALGYIGSRLDTYTPNTMLNTNVLTETGSNVAMSGAAPSTS